MPKNTTNDSQRNNAYNTITHSTFICFVFVAVQTNDVIFQVNRVAEWLQFEIVTIDYRNRIIWFCSYQSKAQCRPLIVCVKFFITLLYKLISTFTPIFRFLHQNYKSYILELHIIVSHMQRHYSLSKIKVYHNYVQ